MIKNKKYILSFLLFILLFLLTYFYIFRRYDFNLLIQILKECNTTYILLAVLCMILYPVFEAIFIHMFSKNLGCNISFYKALGYTFTEIYFSGITPSSTGGQPIQMLEMKKDKIPYYKSTTIVIINTIIYKLTLVFLLILSLIFYHKEIFDKFYIFKYLVLFGSIFNILFVLLLIALLYSKRAINFIKKIIIYIINHISLVKNKEKYIENISRTIDKYKNISSDIKENKPLLIKSFIILLLQRLSILLVSYFVYKSFGLNKYSIFLIIAFQVCIISASDFIPTPGGIMVTEGIIIAINKYLYTDFNDISAMILQRSINFYLLMIISFIFYIIFHYDKRRNTPKD